MNDSPREEDEKSTEPLVTPEPKVETVIRKIPPEAKLLKKYSIPEFSTLKKFHPSESSISRKISHQDFTSLRKLPRTPESPVLKKMVSDFVAASSVPESPAESNSEVESSDQLPSLTNTPKLPLESIKFPLLKGGSRVSTISLERDPGSNEHHSSSVSSSTVPQSASAFIDQSKQFTFQPHDDQKTILEDRSFANMPLGTSTSQSMSCNLDSSGYSSQNLAQLVHQLSNQDKPSHESISSLQRSESPKRTHSSNESIPHDVSCSPPTDSSMEQAFNKTEGARRKPPNKFLKRAQSFSQFLKKKPGLPERRKRSGESSRDDYYLPVSHEQLEEPQGEMMLVPVEKLVAVADLDLDRRDWNKY